jgi:2-polyprenyl-3-methyl-5-hydroxy-6-metoxy-1,4-benzoquinol methylase
LNKAFVPGCSAGAFDVIFANSILHHINDTAALWAEVRRLATSGALVFMRDLARPATPQIARDIVNRHAGSESPLLQEEYHRSLLAAYTPEEVRLQLCRASLAGLEVAMATDRHMDVWGHR